MKVGFIGLGAMGSGMAHNVLAAGHELVVYDLDRDRGTEFERKGAVWAGSVADLAAGVEVVLTSLPGPVQMREVALGDGGLLSHLPAGSSWFDLTTNSPTVVRDVADACRAARVDLFDAPVSGGPKGAASGTLAIYVGGDREALARHGGVLGAIGDQIVYVGGIGAGNVAKLVHNYASLTTRMAIAEAFTLGVKAGVEPAELWHAVRVGAIGRSRTFDRIGDQYLQQRLDPPSFALELAVKDLRLARDLGDEVGVPLKIGEVVGEDFDEAMDRGWARRDSRSPMMLQNERAGVDIKLTADEVEEVLSRS